MTILHAYRPHPDPAWGDFCTVPNPDEDNEMCGWEEADHASSNPFEVGDRADHVSGELDPREVVDVDGDSIFIYIGPAPHDRVGPLPAENYRRIPKP